MSEHRWLHRVLGKHLDVSAADGTKDAFQTLQVHRLGETVPGGLEHQGVVWRNDVSRVGVVLALDLRREDGGQQVVGAHSLQGGRHLLSAGVAEQGQESRGVPPPAGAEQGRLKDCLGQHFLHRVGRQVGEHLVQGEGHVGTQGEVEAVVGG